MRAASVIGSRTSTMIIQFCQRDSEEEQITHEIQLEEDLKVEDGLGTYTIYYANIFLYGLMLMDDRR